MVRSPIDEIQNPTGPNNGLAEICSLQICRKFVKKKKKGVNMVRRWQIPHLLTKKLKQGVYHLLVTKQMRYLPSLPQIYSSVFTNLRHICE